MKCGLFLLLFNQKITANVKLWSETVKYAFWSILEH